MTARFREFDFLIFDLKMGQKAVVLSCEKLIDKRVETLEIGRAEWLEGELNV